MTAPFNAAYARSYPGAAQPEQPEQILVRFRRHGKILFWPVMALLLASFLAGMFLGAFAQQWQNILLGCALCVLVIAGFAVPFVGWLGARSTITTKRVIARSGIFTRTRQEIFINRVRAVNSRRSLLQRLCGSGDIEIYIIGGSDPLLLADVPGVKDISEILQSLVEVSYLRDSAGAGFVAAGQPFFGQSAVLQPAGNFSVPQSVAPQSAYLPQRQQAQPSQPYGAQNLQPYPQVYGQRQAVGQPDAPTQQLGVANEPQSVPGSRFSVRRRL